MSENILIHNVESGEIVERQATKTELENLEKVRKDFENYKNSVVARQEARNSALNKLIDLGLTEEEIAAL